jgi:uncharacterized membrane protein YsdA (DUF1294 family)/cold shock CspA family protein
VYQVQQKGKIIQWNDVRGFGFIEKIGTTEHFFVHIRAMPKGRRPQRGDMVFFDATVDERGRLRAVEVCYSRPLPMQTTHYSWTSPRSLLAFSYFILLLCLVSFTALPVAVLMVSMLLSALTFWVYKLDKISAQQGRRRTPERTLHLLSLCGGWAGALWAQLFLRHKSKKTAFLVPFWMTVVMNLMVVLLWAQQGASFLRYF